MRDYFLAKLGSVKEAEACFDWAIGAEYAGIPIFHWPDLWNRRHGRLIRLCATGNAFKDCDKIINLWRDMYE